MAEQPFKISIPDDKLILLKKKLELTTFPDELEDAQWAYGAPLADVKRIVGRWAGGYDWREHEAKINAELPQFTRDIDVDGHGTLNIHYVHQSSTRVKNAIPLLFVHGWPGSFLEARKFIPLIAGDSSDGPAFHIVAISLPGFGFSQAPKTKGFDIAQHAEVCHKLMLALGYDEYVTQGGDWGYAITRMMGKLYGPKHVKAWHTNMVWETATQCNSGLPRRQWDILLPILRLDCWRGSTKNWSPGPTHILGKTMKARSRPMFYRAIDISCPTASLRIYYEAGKGVLEDVFTTADPPNIPIGLSHFPKDIIIFPRSWTRAIGDIIFERDHESGGHFPAYERPQELAEDLRLMFGQGGPAFGIVSAGNGYD
ncbi:unnamed protein product [Mycena citricolor]|uniref:Epoxide hydrolase N-terminal domain-containing protein n=1 Tax=Mycena citricolor TaxID=2018698 RepID=A0AAD2Q3I9_9AGAR|nr:unnamed protein product [Mycena citricolor]